MAIGQAYILTNDKEGKAPHKLYFSNGVAGTLNGASEFGFVLPQAPNGNNSNDYDWLLTDVILTAGTNTTHSDGAITLSVEHDGDGGTAVADAPEITDNAGTGAVSTVAAGTGISQFVFDEEDESFYFEAGEQVFVTLSESGSGGTDPSDVFFVLEFTRRQDFDPTV